MRGTSVQPTKSVNNSVSVPVPATTSSVDPNVSIEESRLIDCGRGPSYLPDAYRSCVLPQ
jgi:hypothetical protein